MNEITRRGLTAIAEEMNCISKSSHNIAGTLAAMIGAEDALHYADSGNTNNQDIFCNGMNVQSKSHIPLLYIYIQQVLHSA